MTRNEALKKCEAIANDTTLSVSDREDKIVEFVLQTEEKYSKKDVENFIEKISNSTTINLDGAKLWNMVRDKW